MNQKTVVGFVVVPALLASCHSAETEKKNEVVKRPNVVIITWHDTGRWFGCYGNKFVHTPNIDSLAADGYRFSNYWSTSSVSSPSRTSMLTGKYPATHGVKGLCHGPMNYSIRENEHHLSKVLRDAGFDTYLFGWQHETTHDLVHERLGFNHICYNDPTPPAEFTADTFDHFLAHRSAQAGPFYAQIGFAETHIPFDMGGVKPDSSNGIFIPGYLQNTPGARQTIAQLQGAIKKADSCAGAIIGALKKYGFDENTIVVFTCDHGVELKRAKATLYDPGMEVPLVMRWPAGRIMGGKVSDMLSCHADFYPTLLELLELPVQKDVQGISFVKVFNEGNPTPIRSEIFGSFIDQHRCIRTDSFKLIVNFEPHAEYTQLPVIFENAQKYPIFPFVDKQWPIVELYNLKNDPNEFVNLSFNFEYAATKRKLMKKLTSWMKASGDNLIKAPQPSPWFERTMQDIN